MDGEPVEWKGAATRATDAAGDPIAGAPTSCDVVGVAVVRDGERLAVMVRLAAEPVQGDGTIYALDVSTDGRRFDHRICGAPPVVFRFAEGTNESTEVDLAGVESAVGEVAEFALPPALFPGGLPDKVALKAVVVAPSGDVADECEFLWEKPSPAGGALLVEDPAGDSTGPQGSDLAQVEVSREGETLRVTARVAGERGPAQSGVAWSVALATADFYDRAIVVWTDEEGAARAGLFCWASREVPPDNAGAQGVSATLGSSVEVTAPLALLLSDGASVPFWIRVSAIDPISGNAFDEVHLQCDGTGPRD